MATLQTNLKRRAIAWAGQLTRAAKGYAPAHLQPYIHTTVQDSANGFTLKLGVVNKAPTGPGHPNYGSSDARAQEYGSGREAQRGSKANYDIVPIEKPQLIFPGTHEFAGMIIYTQHVSHPGIKAANDGKGYLRPAIADLRKRMRADLTEDLRDAIRTTMRTTFTGFDEE